jgi:hypothetical protein
VRITVVTVGDEALAAAARMALPRLQERTRDAVRNFTPLLAERIQTAASGRPGPNIVSGNLYGSIEMTQQSSEWGEATVGTSVPYAQRLEYGFYGTDSLGRNYSQPPYPFFSRAVEGSAEEFVSVLQRAINGG